MNGEWLCVVPFWAAWPYETMLLPLRHTLSFKDLDDAQRDGIENKLLAFSAAVFSVYPFSV